MYTPQHFAETDPSVLRDTVRQIRAGELITYGSDGIEASYLPLLISDDATLVTGHLAKANGQWRRADLSVSALVSWVGPSAYVSPRYYPSKDEGGRVVPTWNYIAVEAKGTLILHEDDEWKRRHVESLTTVHEGGHASSWSVADAPDDYIAGMIKAIVGLEVQLTSLAGKWKLSQNRSPADLAGVIAGLNRDGGTASEAAVAAEMAPFAARTVD